MGRQGLQTCRVHSGTLHHSRARSSGCRVHTSREMAASMSRDICQPNFRAGWAQQMPDPSQSIPYSCCRHSGTMSSGTMSAVTENVAASRSSQNLPAACLHTVNVSTIRLFTDELLFGRAGRLHPLPGACTLSQSTGVSVERLVARPASSREEAHEEDSIRMLYEQEDG